MLVALAPLRRAVIGAAINPGRLVAAGETKIWPMSDEEILDATGASFHPTSTCAIGAESDPMAVVDPYCRVYGVQGLRVADASVMPENRHRQHQHADDHDRRKGRRVHAHSPSTNHTGIEAVTITQLKFPRNCAHI